MDHFKKVFMSLLRKNINNFPSTKDLDDSIKNLEQFPTTDAEIDEALKDIDIEPLPDESVDRIMKKVNDKIDSDSEMDE